MHLINQLKTTKVKVNFYFNGLELNCESTTKVFEHWESELPSKGDFIAYDSNNYRGEVQRVEWNLDTPDEVYVVINSVL